MTSSAVTAEIPAEIIGLAAAAAIILGEKAHHEPWGTVTALRTALLGQALLDGMQE